MSTDEKMIEAWFSDPEVVDKLRAMADKTAASEPVPDDFTQLRWGYEIGDSVEVRTSEGEWVPAVARSLPRFDRLNAVRRHHPTLTVAVEVGTWEHPVNWPAEDVRASEPPVLGED